MGWDYIGSGDHGGGGWMVMMGDQTEKTGRMEEAEKWRCEERLLSAFRRRTLFVVVVIILALPFKARSIRGR